MKNKITRYGITANRLPSGSWNARIKIEGNSKSVTAPTWEECLEKAYEMKKSQERITSGNITLGEAINNYIQLRTPVVSPATIRTYNSYSRNWLQDLSTLPINKMDKSALQTLINKMVASEKSTKFMKSVIAFVTAVYNESTESNKAFKVIYPQTIKQPHYLPTEADLSVLMVYCKVNDMEVYKAICISLITNLRIGQVCALKGKDLDPKNRLVSSFTSLVRSEDTWIEKAPKTDVSGRMILVPGALFDIIGPVDKDERIIKATPHTIGERFTKCVKRAGLHHFVFHDLRHFNASMYHKMQIPEQYAIARGGWANVSVMNNIYTQTFQDEQLRYDNLVNDVYARLLK